MLRQLYSNIYSRPQYAFFVILVWILLCGVVEQKVASDKKFLKWTWKAMFVVVFALCIGIFSYAALGERYQTSEFRYQLHLFWSYEEVFVNNSAFMREQIFWNVFAFVPVGHALNCLWAKSRWWKVLLICLMVSLSVELIQLVLRIGLFELDDIFHNVLGGVLGYAAAGVVRRLFGWALRRMVQSKGEE